MKVILAKTQIFTMDVEKEIGNAKKFAKLLSKYKLKGEFYICGYLVKEYPEECKKIAKNHIIGGHGYNHENFVKIGIGQQKSIIKLTKRTFEENGIKMVGWRFPGLNFTSQSLELIARLGIYDSSFRLPAMRKWKKSFFLRNWVKNIVFNRVLTFPKTFPKSLVEKPFVVVDIENPDFFKYDGRIITHCWNYPNFEDKIKIYLGEKN